MIGHPPDRLTQTIPPVTDRLSYLELCSLPLASLGTRLWCLDTSPPSVDRDEERFAAYLMLDNWATLYRVLGINRDTAPQRTLSILIERLAVQQRQLALVEIHAHLNRLREREGDRIDVNGGTVRMRAFLIRLGWP
ncbi:hypothetical protein LTR53_002706 [Teratosphaeriaceae sp. CCFEE 6253]|nr:hypothetical protein LTR53_002706 [Teratosphaeriaceae sp. CCFEE 6253]